MSTSMCNIFEVRGIQVSDAEHHQIRIILDIYSPWKTSRFHRATAVRVPAFHDCHMSFPEDFPNPFIQDVVYMQYIKYTQNISVLGVSKLAI